MLPAIAGSGSIIGVLPRDDASGLARLLATGAAPVQLGGTDRVPTAPALPSAAEIAPPRPPEPSGPAAALALGAIASAISPAAARNASGPTHWDPLAVIRRPVDGT